MDKPTVDIVNLANSYVNAHNRKQEPTHEESAEAAVAFKTTLDNTIKTLDKRNNTNLSGERCFGVIYDEFVELTFGKYHNLNTSELTPYVSLMKYTSREEDPEDFLTLRFDIDEGKFVSVRSTLSNYKDPPHYLGIDEAHMVRKFMDNVLAYDIYKANQ